MSTLPGLFVLGEANFSDHGANRLGASALMQGLADGYFIILPIHHGELPGPEKASKPIRPRNSPPSTPHLPKPKQSSARARPRNCWLSIKRLTAPWTTTTKNWASWPYGNYVGMCRSSEDRLEQKALSEIQKIRQEYHRKRARDWERKTISIIELEKGGQSGGPLWS